MSLNITMVTAMMPLPPTPWIIRPASSFVKFFDRQQRSVPTVKSNIDNVRSSRQPKIPRRAAMKGWKTVYARKYDISAENASVALPLVELAIVRVN